MPVKITSRINFSGSLGIGIIKGDLINPSFPPPLPILTPISDLYLISDNNLIDYWKFNNDFIDYKTNNSLTNNNSVSFSNISPFYSSATADFGSTQDGNKGLSTGPIGINLNDANNNTSVSFWIYLNNLPTVGSRRNYIFDWKAASSGYLTLSYLFSGSNYGFELNYSGNSGSYTTTLSTGAWYQIAVTITANTASLNFSGNLNSVTASSGILTASTNEFYIGNNASLAANWVGLIDDFAIFNRLLNSTEIYKLANGWDNPPLS
jgi:hypothetical protein